MKKILTPAFLRYLLVGGFGFLVDAGGMEVLTHLGREVHAARAFSMTFAIFCTYLLHRGYTFSDSRKQKAGRQFAAFGAVQLCAAALNYGIFCAALWALPVPPPGLWEDAAHLFALGLGVGAGLVFNYAVLRLLVFPAGDGEAAAPRETPRRKKFRAAVTWILFAAALLPAALSRQGQVLLWPRISAPLQPDDPDAWMRLVQVRQWLAGGVAGFFDHAVRHTNAPFGGISTPWTRPMDALLSAFYFVMPQGLPVETRLMLAQTWLPPVMFAVAALLLARAAERHFRHSHAMILAALLALFDPGLRDIFSPGDSDHHGLMCLLWCAVISFLMDRAMTLGMAAAMGALMGGMLWVSTEALAPMALVFALMGAGAVLRPERANRILAAAFGAASVVTAALFVEMPVADIFSRLTYDSISIVHAALLWLTVAAAAFVTFAFRKEMGSGARLFAGLSAFAVMLMGMMAFYPRFFLGPFADVDPFIFTGFLPRVGEARPLFRAPVFISVHDLAVPLLAIAVLAAALAGKRSRANRRQAMVLCVLLGGMLLMTLVQLRWNYYLQPPAVAAVAAFLPGLGAGWRRWRYLPRFVRPYVLPWAVYMIASILLQARTAGPAAADPYCMEELRYAVQTGRLQERLGGKPLVLFTHEDAGGDVQFFTPYGVIASNYHREGAGMRALKEIIDAPAAEKGLALLKKRKGAALYYCARRYPQKSWLREAAEKAEKGKYVKGTASAGAISYPGLPSPPPVLLKVK